MYEHPTPRSAATWPPAVASDFRARGLWRDVTLFDAVRDAAATHAGREALVDGDRRWTYADLVVEVEALAAGLRARLDVGDRVLVQLPNVAEYVLTTLACLAAGIVPVWSVPQHRTRELTAFASHCAVRAVVTTSRHRGVDHEALAHEVREAVSSVEHVVVVGSPSHRGSTPFTDLSGGHAQRKSPVDDGPSDADALAVLIPSGGTTGASKLVPRTHNDLDCMLRAACDRSRFDHTSRYLAVLPLGHGFVNTGPGVLGSLVAGGTVVVCPSPAPEVALPLAAQERVTATSVVPAILARWVEHAATAVATRPVVPTMRLLQVGGARLEPDLAERAEHRIGGVVQQVFGMSEGLTCTTRVVDRPEVRWGTVGRPISPADEIRVVDEDGVPTPVGTPGLLLARGPYTVRGYYRSPSSDATAFTPDGWYVTGDLVVCRPDGRLVITGRATDTINRGAEKVSAEEVESLIHELDAVGDCAVVGVPDPVYGAEVAVFVVPVAQRPVSLEDVANHLERRGLAAYKVPRHIFQTPRIPLTGIGKVDRHALRETAREAMAEWST